jgi:putative two-component system response regulator
VVLLDVMMPDMDGFDVCRVLRADPRTAEVPIILVTALDDRDALLQGIDAGADELIVKPFNRLELRTRLRSLTRINR